MATRKRTTERVDSPALNDWAAALAQLAGTKAESVPAGWKTVKELGEELLRDRSHMSRSLRLLKAQGKAESRMFRVMVGQYARPTEHWRLV